MKPAARPRPAEKPRPASSLGGLDRHLVARPFQPLMAADFELGSLAADGLEPGFKDLLSRLEAGLLSGTLPFDSFDSFAATVSRILYDKPGRAGISTVRFAAPVQGPGAVTSARLRVLARGRNDQSGAATTRSTLGLVIAAPDASGAWLVRHFELDLAALELPQERAQAWDPYSSMPAGR